MNFFKIYSDEGHFVQDHKRVFNSISQSVFQIEAAHLYYTRNVYSHMIFFEKSIKISILKN